MRALLAFLKKEWMEWLRGGKIISLIVVFVILGIMNPAIAKITPLLMETMSESLEESGLIVGEVTVDAMASWTQYYKNMPIALIVFALIISTSFTSEYNKGSLVLVVTKGLARWKIYMAKGIMFMLAWTGGYWLQYFITYFYNDFYWDNSIANKPLDAAIFVWLFGVFIISLIMFFSSMAASNTVVLGGTVVVVIACYIIEMIPKVSRYAPTKLMGTFSILTDDTKVSEYYIAALVVIILSAIALIMGNMLFLRKKL